MAQKLNDFLFLAAVLSHCWNYENQDKWPAERCHKAIAQSPIDLRFEKMIQINMAPLVFTNWDQDYNVSMMNNGHTVKVNFPCKNQTTVSVSGGGLPGTYDLVEFHFHWGSEHILNGNRQALEAHFVGFNNKFKSEEEALGYTNGIAVLSVLYEISDDDNFVFHPIIQKIEKLKNVNGMTGITINPGEFLPNDVINFYRYSGSLTSPDCNDVVVWTIFSEVCKVSQNQVDAFRSILNAEGKFLTKNFRSIQPLNGRTVYKISVNESIPRSSLQ